jgi:hypothetical protein
MRTDELWTAYQRFIAEAVAGEFGPPPRGEWNAQQLVAHIATNDLLLIEVIEQVLAGVPARLDNSGAASWPKVTAYAEEHGGLAGTIEALRESSTRLCEAVRRLDDERQATEIGVYIVNGEDIAVDQPMPIGQLLAVQASYHLPAHTEQLRALRPA